MNQPTVCPYLGLAGDPTLSRTQPDSAHRCYVQVPPAAPEPAHQATFCLAAAHQACPFFRAPASGTRGQEHAADMAPSRPSGWLLALPWAGLLIVAAIVAIVYYRDWRAASTARPTATPAPAIAPAVSPVVMPSLTPSPVPLASPVPTPTLTPEPGGRVLVLAPRAGDAGWFASGEARGNHLGDSFLYAGYFGGQVFISAVRFDLSRVPRGAPIRAATLQLSGLKGDRFNPAAGGTWSVQLLSAAALPDYARATFQALFNAPAAITLVPTLYPADLIIGRSNTWVIDPGGREWLMAQLVDGATAVIARIAGPAGGDDTLFAWDSGTGPTTLGAGPQLVLHLGPPPPTPPPLPTEAVIVATLTPTPANILTVAAQAWTATAVARTTGTATPLPYRVVTPTPSPANLATVQALALLRGLPPVVPHTPTPANEATAEALALYATAQAFLTGTPTPPPRDAVTPIVIIPTATPENVLTLVAHILQATADVAEFGTPTPWPYNAVLATSTPPWLVIFPPANAATAQAQAAYATAVAQVFGTYTPLPPNAATPTPPGFVAPRPTATPTPPLPASCPDPRAQIAAPGPGQAVGPTVIVSGTAAGPYQLAYAAGANATEGYVEFFRGEQPVAGRRLGVLDATSLPAGAYTVRLTVFDGNGGELPACTVSIVLIR